MCIRDSRLAVGGLGGRVVCGAARPGGLLRGDAQERRRWLFGRKVHAPRRQRARLLPGDGPQRRAALLHVEKVHRRARA
eukprot:7973278-Pyramimonas_sp.AAC.1